MSNCLVLSNERQLRETAALVEGIDRALTSEELLRNLAEGLPPKIVEGLRKSLRNEKRELLAAITAYEAAKAGNTEQFQARAGHDPGVALIVARISKGWSQKDLARRLFVPEQQVQRYESERYRSTSLGNLIRVARALGVRIRTDLSNTVDEKWLPSYEMSSAEAQKILKHARQNDWVERSGRTDEDTIADLKRTVAEHVAEHGVPSLLRTGLNVEDHSRDWLLLTWKAQVTRRAKQIIQSHRPKYRPLEVQWLRDLVHLSAMPDGIQSVPKVLFDHGIALIAEPNIPGMKVDGAAFLIGDTPVIALTLLRDSVDNFWFTLLHEVAHIILHYRTGLSAGFFDDSDNPNRDEMEAEADEFAQNLIVADEMWARSAARISKVPEPVVKLAQQINVAPEIIFGRIRKERNNYTIFSDKIGQGSVRKHLFRIDGDEL